MSGTTTIKVRTTCPFPNCQHESASQLGAHVYRCNHCRRLSIQCEKPSCGALNRPFILYCRRCRDWMLDDKWQGTCEQLWSRAARIEAQGLGSEVGPAETIIDLSKLRDYKRPASQIAIRFLQGLLAVHQSGGYLALLHPFRGNAETGNAQESVLWTDRELVHCPPEERPFAPMAMGDHRHILFSNPYAAYSVQVWSLRDWAYDAKPRYQTLVDASDESAPKLQAAPVVLDAEHIGILSGHSEQQQYFWTTLQWNTGTPQRLRAGGECTVALRLEGWPCQLMLVEKTALAFSTPKGHWLWRFEDAIHGRIENLRRTWPCPGETADSRLRLDSEVEDPRQFHRCRQLIHDPGLGKYFEWFFTRGAQQANLLYWYRVNRQTLEANFPQTRGIDASPLGAHDDKLTQPVMLAQGRRLLGRSTGEPYDWPGFGAIDDLDAASGLNLQDPLVLIIATGRSGNRVLTVRSLTQTGQRLECETMPLKSDPVTWSHWLFTVEVEELHRLVVRRRDLNPAAETHAESSL